jgi:hypothetical protein
MHDHSTHVHYSHHPCTNKHIITLRSKNRILEITEILWFCRHMWDRVLLEIDDGDVTTPLFLHTWETTTGMSWPHCCFTRERRSTSGTSWPHYCFTREIRRRGRHNPTVASHVRDRRLELIKTKTVPIRMLHSKDPGVTPALLKTETVPIRMLHSKDPGVTPALRSQGIERWRADSPLRVLPLSQHTDAAVC